MLCIFYVIHAVSIEASNILPFDGGFKHTNPDVVAKASSKLLAETYIRNLFAVSVAWQKADAALNGPIIITDYAAYGDGYLFKNYKGDATKIHLTFLPIKMLTKKDVQEGLEELWRLFYRAFPMPANAPPASQQSTADRIAEIRKLAAERHAAYREQRPLPPPQTGSSHQSQKPSSTTSIVVQPQAYVDIHWQADLQRRIRDLLFTTGGLVEGVKARMINKTELQEVYAIYLSLDQPKPPFEIWLQGILNDATMGTSIEELEKMHMLNSYIEEYEALPEEARQSCNFYQFLLLSQAFNASEHPDQKDPGPLKIDFDTIKTLSGDWNYEGGLGFFDWFNVYMPNVRGPKSLTTAREIYKQGHQMGKISNCTFYQWILFYTAFRYESHAPKGQEIRVDFTVLEHLFTSWKEARRSQNITEFSSWLESLSWYNPNLREQMIKHWLPAYRGFYWTMYPGQSFVEFLKFQYRYETNKEAQEQFDAALAKYLFANQRLLR
jgi:hypothetical protein